MSLTPSSNTMLSNSIETLRRELRRLKCKKQVDYQGLLIGNPSSFVELYRYLFCEFDHDLSGYFVERHFDLFGLTDYKFMEGVYRCLRDLFSEKAPISIQQFFTSSAFAEKKISMASQLVQRLQQLQTRLHKELTGQKSVMSQQILQSSNGAASRSRKKHSTRVHKDPSEDVEIIDYSGGQLMRSNPSKNKQRRSAAPNDELQQKYYSEDEALTRTSKTTDKETVYGRKNKNSLETHQNDRPINSEILTNPITRPLSSTAPPHQPMAFLQQYSPAALDATTANTESTTAEAKPPIPPNLTSSDANISALILERMDRMAQRIDAIEFRLTQIEKQQFELALKAQTDDIAARVCALPSTLTTNNHHKLAARHKMQPTVNELNCSESAVTNGHNWTKLVADANIDSQEARPNNNYGELYAAYRQTDRPTSFGNDDEGELIERYEQFNHNEHFTNNIDVKSWKASLSDQSRMNHHNYLLADQHTHDFDNGKRAERATERHAKLMRDINSSEEMHIAETKPLDAVHDVSATMISDRYKNQADRIEDMLRQTQSILAKADKN